MSRESFEKRREQLAKALDKLKISLRLDENSSNRPEEERDAFKDSVIQRFEFTYELSWKTLKAWLSTQGMEISYPKQALAQAFAGALISDESGWSELVEARNDTSHTYDHEKALAVLALVRAKGISLFDELMANLNSK